MPKTMTTVQVSLSDDEVAAAVERYLRKEHPGVYNQLRGLRFSNEESVEWTFWFVSDEVEER